MHAWHCAHSLANPPRSQHLLFGSPCGVASHAVHATTLCSDMRQLWGIIGPVSARQGSKRPTPLTCTPGHSPRLQRQVFSHSTRMRRFTPVSAPKRPAQRAHTEAVMPDTPTTRNGSQPALLESECLQSSVQTTRGRRQATSAWEGMPGQAALAHRDNGGEELRAPRTHQKHANPSGHRLDCGEKRPSSNAPLVHDQPSVTARLHPLNKAITTTSSYAQL